jgi:hypothetical protein
MAHPLTDEICDQIQDSIHPCDPENMRAAADWQLEQVIDWVSKFGWYLFEHPCQKHEFISELKKAMRPQQ